MSAIRSSMSCTAQTMEVPTFRPSLEEAEGSWEAYMLKIEPDYEQVGICKIIPPEGWRPSNGSVEDKDMLISGPVSQELTGIQGLYQARMEKKSPMPLHGKYKPYATDIARQPPAGCSCPEDVEREFWRSTTRAPPIYGADTEATFFDGSCKGWNLSQLDSLLTRGLKKRIPGVNTSYLYFGVWRSFFGWHTEDMDLHSVNYLHYGAPKQWYCIPPVHRARFEAYVRNTLSDCFRACPSFFRHKELLLSPKRLHDADIPFVKVLQYPGEMIVNSPGAYHAGFNSGFNCAEATNFATESWLKHGAQADVCECRADSVSIDMREFLQFATPEVQEIITSNFYTDSESDSDSEPETSCGDCTSKDTSFKPAASKKGRPKTVPVSKPSLKRSAKVPGTKALPNKATASKASPQKASLPKGCSQKAASSKRSLQETPSPKASLQKAAVPKPSSEKPKAKSGLAKLFGGVSNLLKARKGAMKVSGKAKDAVKVPVKDQESLPFKAAKNKGRTAKPKSAKS